MKGIIFTSFIEFAELNFGFDFVDDMIKSVKLTTHGAYTNVGSYPAQELLDMVDHIVRSNNTEPTAMQREFGSFTFGNLVARYPQLVEKYTSSFECIYEVDQTIHKSVRKLYPDAELPDLNAQINAVGNKMTLEYRSSRPLLNVANGLLRGCIKYYGENIKVEMTDLSDGKYTLGRFTLVKHG